MENITHALYIAFAMLAFVLAFSVSINMIVKLNTTTDSVVYSLNRSYYDSLELESVINDNNGEKNRSRLVGIETIIPTLYRYYKESFSVKILDEKGQLMQYFDVTTDGEVNEVAKAVTAGSSLTSKQNSIKALYNDLNKPSNMFGAPWIGKIDNAKKRIDMFISGSKGYIETTEIDYSKDYNNGLSISPDSYGTLTNKIYLNNFKNRKFKETFAQYAYEGDTVSDDSTGDLITLTGSKQISTKIVITYQLMPA